MNDTKKIKFESFGLNKLLLKALKDKNYEYPTPIQEQSIPLVLKGEDVLGIAQTGTGKTAAFSLPLLDHIYREKKKMRPARMRALILTPTRELASQIEENIKEYSKESKLKTAVIFGGVGPRPQIMKMAKGVDILIATPGRLLDLMGDGHILYDQLDFFILDEADRMLDMGFLPDIRKVIKKLPKERQNLFFSATMPKEIEKLASTILTNPKKVEVTPQSTTVEKINQTVLFVETSNKPKLLIELLKDNRLKKVLVFSKMKHAANRIVEHLGKASIQAAAIHGNKSQNARELALGNFKKGKIRALVATDIAARGIDIDEVTHIINYHLPNDPKNYVHRIGRTARAGKEGAALSFCDEEEKKFLKQIEKAIKYKIPVDDQHPLHGVPANASVQKRGPSAGVKKKVQKKRPRRKKKKTSTSR